jgi:predicted nucleic acid-binding protein
MKPVLIDTCAWIDFFKSQTGSLGNQVAELIEVNQAAITGVVIAELLQGIKHENEGKRLRLLLKSIHYLSTEDSDWLQAGQLAQQLRKKGFANPSATFLL